MNERYVLGVDFANQGDQTSKVVYVIPFDAGMEKAVAGPFIGPKGGKWANPQHTIPWKPAAPGKVRKFARPMTKRPWIDHLEGTPKQTIDLYRNPDGSYKKRATTSPQEHHRQLPA